MEERNLYSVAYKNVIGARRVAWRTVSSICEKEAKASAEEWQLEEARRYREQLEGELHDLCHEVLDTALAMVGDGDEPASEVRSMAHRCALGVVTVPRCVSTASACDTGQRRVRVLPEDGRRCVPLPCGGASR